MAAAYAALVSLMSSIEQIQHHRRPPISLNKEQVESLTEKIAFLQDFLEGYSPHIGYTNEADGLLSRIADAAYAAEDVIDSHIVDRILAGSISHGEEIVSDEEISYDEETNPGEEISYGEEIISGDEISYGEEINGDFIDLYHGLQRVIEEMDLIKKEVMEIREIIGVHHQLQRNSSISSGSLRSASSVQNKTMVGFDDILVEMMDKLTRGQADRQIIPIVGMGGIGKTTLARNIYANPLIQQHFDICAWATISQDYSTREILREVLCQENKERRGNSNEMSENELGEILYEYLSGRRYLIVMDDIWNIEALDKIKFFFPNYNNGSRIVITTRLSNLAFQLSNSCGIEMKLLDEDKSWNLFETMFKEEGCPPELEEVGKKIVKGCKGLPLSIVVIGGLLAKSKDIQEYWEYIAENLNSVVSLEDNEHCLKILCMSYNQLPIYLKPCFLYMGVFPEDNEIRVSELIKLWVAEGFLRPINGKTLEVVARDYLKELIDRNLILVHQLGSNGKTRLCKFHDLLRDLCLREARKQKFLSVVRDDIHNFPQGLNAERRLCIPRQSEYPRQVIHALETASLARSFISDGIRGLPSFSSRLLRVSSIVDNSLPLIDKPLSPEAISQQVNLRYLAVETISYDPSFRFPSSIHLFWNLQTFILHKFSIRNKIVSFPIWQMPLLRHIKFDTIVLPDPPTDDPDDIILENLQTLCCVYDFKCGEEMLRRIANIKKLEICYSEFKEGYCLNNIGRLHKLESLNFSFQPDTELSALNVHLMHNITFPKSLKKLTLYGIRFRSEDMKTKIGSLPLLEVLKLRRMSFIGPEWETVEGQFCSLKFLLISECCGLKYWTTDSTHFPRLEHLFLEDIHNLEEIPSSIGDIPTLQLIYLEDCVNSAVDSAKRILEEQEDLGNVDLQVLFFPYED